MMKIKIFDKETALTGASISQKPLKKIILRIS